MGYEDRAKQYCEDCKFHNECNWVVLERHANCIDGQTFMYGWEKGCEDTIGEIEALIEQAVLYSDTSMETMFFRAIKEKVEQLKKE